MSIFGKSSLFSLFLFWMTGEQRKRTGIGTGEIRALFNLLLIPIVLIYCDDGCHCERPVPSVVEGSEAISLPFVFEIATPLHHTVQGSQ